TDCADTSVTVESFERAPSVDETGGILRLEILCYGPVDEVEVEYVQPQPAHGRVEGGESVVVALVGVPHLGGEEEFAARHAAYRDGSARALLVEEELRGVD